MDCILTTSEVDFCIETMQPQSLESIGTKPWIDWHQRLQKLNQQAVVEASDLKEEYVKECLISNQKMPVLVHEAILISIWKNKILPILLKLDSKTESTFMVYTILYHEAVAIGLLELVLFHSNGSEALGDSAVDLLDYAYDSASQLLVIKVSETPLKESAVEEIRRHKRALSFDIGIRCLSILRYLSDNLDKLPLNVTSRIYDVQDVPVLLIEILLSKPWVRDGKLYAAGRWKEWDGECLGQAEAQVWLTLYQLLLDKACLSHYPLTESRRNQIMKLQPLLTPLLLDQLSPLLELKQWIYQLSISNQPTAPSKPILLETVLEIKQKILAEGNNKWKKIAQKQYPVIMTKDYKQLVEMAKSLSGAYCSEVFEKLEIKDKNTCAYCQKNAIQRCSQCKQEWYCCRQCQVNHWPQHKDKCMEVSEGKKKN